MRSTLPSTVGQETILIVEDEIRAQRLLRLTLEPFDYRVITHGTAQGVVEMVRTIQPDVVLLDLGLPDADGFHVCQSLRAETTVPIVVLSGSRQVTDKLRAFDLGADDYVTKPYDQLELVARIRAVLRRAKGQLPQRKAQYRYGALTIDFEQHLVTLNGKEVSLSRTEYRLLECLARNAGFTLVSDAILAKVWGAEYTGDYASLHLYISRLRRKLGETSRKNSFIVTKSGIGYMMPREEGDDSRANE